MTTPKNHMKICILLGRCSFCCNFSTFSENKNHSSKLCEKLVFRVGVVQFFIVLPLCLKTMTIAQNNMKTCIPLEGVQFFAILTLSVSKFLGGASMSIILCLIWENLLRTHAILMYLEWLQRTVFFVSLFFGPIHNVGTDKKSTPNNGIFNKKNTVGTIPSACETLVTRHGSASNIYTHNQIDILSQLIYLMSWPSGKLLSLHDSCANHGFGNEKDKKPTYFTASPRGDISHAILICGPCSRIKYQHYKKWNPPRQNVE